MKYAKVAHNEQNLGGWMVKEAHFEKPKGVSQLYAKRDESDAAKLVTANITNDLILDAARFPFTFYNSV